MADRVSIDDSELRAFATRLESAGGRLAPEVRQVVSRGALNIKRQLVAEMGASRSFKGVARSIGYDMSGNASYSEAQIGPSSDPGSAGNLANVAIFGTSRGGGTVPDPQGALDAEAPRFEAALGDVLGDLL